MSVFKCLPGIIIEPLPIIVHCKKYSCKKSFKAKDTITDNIANWQSQLSVIWVP